MIRGFSAATLTLTLALASTWLGAGAARADALGPLPAAKQKIFLNSPEDTLNKPQCVGKRRRVTLKCRDIRHYVRMNEWHHYAWRPFVQNLGGAYFGIASDQSFTFIAWAKSKIAFLMDYDPVVVRVNYMHRAFVLHSSTPKEYVALFGRRGRKRALKVLETYYKSHKFYKGIRRVYRRFRGEIGSHFRSVMRRARSRKFHWLHDQADYDYIRNLFKVGRVRILEGDLLKDKTLRGIGAITHKLGIPIRIIYLSNAEEFWAYPKDFRLNFASLKMDDKTVVLRTRHSSKYGPRLGSYVYIVQSGLDFQKKLKAGKRWAGVWAMLRDRKVTHRPGLFVIGPVKQGYKPPRRGKRKRRKRARR